MIARGNCWDSDCRWEAQLNHGVAKILLWIFLRSLLDIPYGESAPQGDGKIPYKFAVEPTLPKAIVLNVDQLLWPYKVDKVMTPPLRSGRNRNEIRDRMGKIYRLFNDTRPILDDLFSKWYLLGGLVISTDPEKIENIMSLYDIERYFGFYEVFPRTPGCKVKHMKRMSDRLKVKLDEMLYFDADEDQLDEVEELEVTVVKISSQAGLKFSVLQSGFHLYQAAHNTSDINKRAHMVTESPQGPSGIS